MKNKKLQWGILALLAPIVLLLAGLLLPPLAKTKERASRIQTAKNVVSVPVTLAVVVFLTVGLLLASNVLAAETNVPPVPRVAITNLLAHKQAYQGKRVEVSGYYVGFFEHCALYESQTTRSLTNSLWIDPFREQPGYRQNISGGRGDFRGNVRIIGTFHYRPDLTGVGHLNGWPAEITKLELFEKPE